MYKDKDKQREANRERQRRYKERQKGVTSEGVTITVTKDEVGDILDVIPELTAQGNIRVSKPGNEGKVDEAEKAKRTAAAIKYQHLFPDRYEPNSDTEEHTVFDRKKVEG